MISTEIWWIDGKTRWRCDLPELGVHRMRLLPSVLRSVHSYCINAYSPSTSICGPRGVLQYSTQNTSSCLRHYGNDTPKRKTSRTLYLPSHESEGNQGDSQRLTVLHRLYTPNTSPSRFICIRVTRSIQWLPVAAVLDHVWDDRPGRAPLRKVSACLSG